MLYITRKPGQAVIVDHAVEVRVVEVRGRTVRLGFRFPPTCSVLREEVYRQVERANARAAACARELLDGGGSVLAKGERDGERDGQAGEGGGGDGKRLRLGDHAPRGGGAG